MVYGLMTPLDEVSKFLDDFQSDSWSSDSLRDESGTFKRYVDLVDGSSVGVGEYRWFISNASGWNLAEHVLVDFVKAFVGILRCVVLFFGFLLIFK